MLPPTRHQSHQYLGGWWIFSLSPLAHEYEDDANEVDGCVVGVDGADDDDVVGVDGAGGGCVVDVYVRIGNSQQCLP